MCAGSRPGRQPAALSRSRGDRFSTGGQEQIGRGQLGVAERAVRKHPHRGRARRGTPSCSHGRVVDTLRELSADAAAVVVPATLTELPDVVAASFCPVVTVPETARGPGRAARSCWARHPGPWTRPRTTWLPADVHGRTLSRSEAVSRGSRSTRFARHRPRADRRVDSDQRPTLQAARHSMADRASRNAARRPHAGSRVARAPAPATRTLGAGHRVADTPPATPASAALPRAHFRWPRVAGAGPGRRPQLPWARQIGPAPRPRPGTTAVGTSTRPAPGSGRQ
jgi:hypothetical protein